MFAFAFQGYVRDTTCPLRPTSETSPNEEPCVHKKNKGNNTGVSHKFNNERAQGTVQWRRTSQRAVSDIRPYYSCGSQIFAQGIHSYNFIIEISDRVTTCNVLLRIDIVATKGIKKGVDHPSNQDRIVRDYHVGTRDRRDTNTSPTAMKAAKDTNISRLVVLSQTDLKDEKRNTNEKQSHEVWNKEGATTILYHRSADTVRKTSERAIVRNDFASAC